MSRAAEIAVVLLFLLAHFLVTAALISLIIDGFVIPHRQKNKTFKRQQRTEKSHDKRAARIIFAEERRKETAHHKQRDEPHCVRNVFQYVLQRDHPTVPGIVHFEQFAAECVIRVFALAFEFVKIAVYQHKRKHKHCDADDDVHDFRQHGIQPDAFALLPENLRFARKFPYEIGIPERQESDPPIGDPFPFCHLHKSQSAAQEPYDVECARNDRTDH